ncbi:hypothetical protein TNCV_4450541 [Trichonephila clavipes]|nr:hypothetical protein TNCV_4450541 [Trichonephila clavipes]
MQSGLKDPNNPIIVKEKSYMELTNERLQQAVSEYASLPPCDNPNCSRHTSNNTPAKNNSLDPPTPVPTKRKESDDGFTPLRKLTKTTLSNSNPEINFKVNLTNKYNALENEVPETQVETVTQSPKRTSPTSNATTDATKLPPPTMLQITDDLRTYFKTLNARHTYQGSRKIR